MDYLNYKIKIDVNAITNVDQIWFGSHYTKLANLCGWMCQRRVKTAFPWLVLGLLFNILLR